MIAIIISGKAYAAMAGILPAGSTVERELAPGGEYRVWLPVDVVNRLRALHAPKRHLAMSFCAWHSGVHSRP
jgi:hypothetical protein